MALEEDADRRLNMGYRIIKPMKGGIHSEEYVHVSKSRISFTKALYRRMELTTRRKSVLLYEDTETGNLCFDFKDWPYRDAFTVSVFTSRQNSTTVCVFCAKTIEALGLVPGNYHVTEQDGPMIKTNIKINRDE